MSEGANIPPGLVSVTAPPIPDGIIDEILEKADRAPSPENTSLVGNTFLTMIKLKASQIVELNHGNQRASEYLDRWSMLHGSPVQVARIVLAEACQLEPGATPYMQDFPMRVRAVMLKSRQEPGSFWDDVQ